jgi:hypothetical protein
VVCSTWFSSSHDDARGRFAVASNEGSPGAI